MGGCVWVCGVCACVRVCVCVCACVYVHLHDVGHRVPQPPSVYDVFRALCYSNSCDVSCIVMRLLLRRLLCRNRYECTVATLYLC